MAPSKDETTVCTLAFVSIQQAAIRHDDDSLNRKAFEDRRQHGFQRFRFRHIARVHGVHQRQTLSRLHHAEHALPGDASGFLVHSEGAQIIVDRALVVNADRGDPSSAVRYRNLLLPLSALRMKTIG